MDHSTPFNNKAQLLDEFINEGWEPSDREDARKYYEKMIVELEKDIPETADTLVYNYGTDEIHNTYNWWIEGNLLGQRLYVGFNDDKWTETVVYVDGNVTATRRL